MNSEYFPLISIQVLNWNRAQDTLRAIESAKNQSYTNIEIVFIDNGSEDDSVKLVREKYPEITIVKLDKNYGCPGGRNRGIPYCKGKYIFYLDNDGVLHKEAVKNAFQTMQSQKDIGIVTGQIYDFIFEDEIDAACVFKSQDIYEYNLFQGGISMHDVEIYKVLGYYPDHFIYGQEESFLALKLMDSKYSIIKDETVVLWHKQSEIARNKEKEILNGLFNKLYISIALYPFFATISFLLYFILIYPYHSSRLGVFTQFVNRVKKDFRKTIALGRSNRKPITYRAFFKSAFFKKKVKKNKDV
jgi:GT2 family glycosyltransferase